VGHQNTIFHQILANVPWGQFNRTVAAHRTDKGVRQLDTRTQLIVLLYGQLMQSKSLRRLVDSFASQQRRLYHIGSAKVARSTLSDANAHRSPEVFSALFTALLGMVSPEVAKKAGECVLLLDSTTVRLNRLSGEWARFSEGVHGAKAHIIYDPDADCPIHAVITPERVNDITAAKTMPITPNATYVFDLGYYDFGWWADLDAADCRIVTRFKTNTPLREIGERLVEPGGPILSDRTGLLPARQSGRRHNPMNKRVREIRVRTETGTVLRLLTNDLTSPACKIAGLYKRRWAIELFFRWVKQALKLHKFLGNSENAVRIQITVALIAFLLLRITHARAETTLGMGRFATLVQVNLMHRRTIHDLLGLPENRYRSRDNPQEVLPWAA